MTGSSIERHRRQVDAIRKKYGEDNYVQQLTAIEHLMEFECDEDLKYLFEKERHSLILQIELSKYQTLPDYESTIVSEHTKELVIERNGKSYHIKSTQKNKIFYDTVMYCVSCNKNINELKASDHAIIAVRSLADQDNVRSTLSRIIRETKPGGLTSEEKGFFYTLLANINATENIMKRFPCLAINTMKVV